MKITTMTRNTIRPVSALVATCLPYVGPIRFWLTSVAPAFVRDSVILVASSWESARVWMRMRLSPEVCTVGSPASGTSASSTAWTRSSDVAELAFWTVAVNSTPPLNSTP